MTLLLGILALISSSWTARAINLLSPETPNRMIVQKMRGDPSYMAQLSGCRSIRVDSSNKAAQDQAGQEGVVDAIAEAMRLFPEDQVLVSTCTMTLSSVMLFNRDNGLRAGQLGALNHTLHIYMNHMDNPLIMGLGGAIGAYFDYVDENRRIAGELGGIHAIIQNIKNHFHGKYSEWSYNLVKQSLFALSSGCWVNQDICIEEGFPELAVKLMREHGHEDKIAEETQQVTKALMAKSDVYRAHLVDLGITDSMVHVMQVNAHDRGALDLTCQNFAQLVGPNAGSGPAGGRRDLAFNKTIQSKALESGALDAIMQVVTSGRELHHKEHGSFNFDIDSSYNVKRDCFSALAHLSHEHPVTQAALAEAGLAATVLADLEARPKDRGEQFAGCSLLKQLDNVERTAALTAGLARYCSRSPKLVR
mmetsp:Transcript_91206/g.221484  ORF Transcript_91206/g.221484 Transcript_91206/m.221484 type:complete len:420 (-) Transcript_91206:14-1273(-)